MVIATASTESVAERAPAAAARTTRMPGRESPSGRNDGRRRCRSQVSRLTIAVIPSRISATASGAGPDPSPTNWTGSQGTCHHTVVVIAVARSSNSSDRVDQSVRFRITLWTSGGRHAVSYTIASTPYAAYLLLPTQT